jgi:putative transposase
MKLSYKYRIYPNKAQIEVLNKNFNFCCFIYNSALQERISYYKKYGKSLSYNKQAGELPSIKNEFAEQTHSIYSQTLQQVLKKLDQSYKNFFRRVKEKSSKAGFPRYKSADRFKTLVFPQSDLTGFGVKLLDNKKLSIFGIPGEIKVKWHRPFKGRCKLVMITKQANKFYIVLSCDEVPKELLASTGKTVAIDLGITSFITTDDKTKFYHPKPYKTAKEKLAIKQRKLSLKKKASKNYKRLRNEIAKTFLKVSDIRGNFLHTTAKQLITENDTVIIEKLNVKSMLEAKGFEVNKSNIQDASWATFCSLLKYKAEKAGREIIEVNPRNTSKMCSQCFKIKDNLTLKDRTYNCDACGIAIDRDYNAAKNIRRLGTSLAKDESLFQKPSALC